ncbi:MAG: DNA primase [Candidatus Sungbacteria bacterium]|nr:DNA primase [Candidatus Sungbacteria bacterium]
MNSPTEEIKSRIDIAELVGGYVRLIKAGSNFKALCPFHKEKTPSFNVSPTRQIWHCFGCGKGGDHFKFVMEIEGLDFPEALQLLAKRAGVELKREDPRIRSERNRTYDLLEEAAKYFADNLETVSAIKTYLKKRGVIDKTITDFRIGFSFDSWDGLLRHLHKKKYADAEIEKAGLAIKGEGGSWYDRFRSRIMFPINDVNGRVVGFGGRIFQPIGDSQRPTAEAKYINTPQTLVYDKSRVLYAFDKAKESIRKQNTCVIVEGYMDALMSHQAGVVNTVAVSGTALTAEQLKAIRRLAETVISCFDSDLAGEEATKRSIDLAVEFDFERKAAILPHGIKDPADAVLQNPQAWQKAVLEAVPITQLFFDNALLRFNPETSEGAKAIAAAVLPEIKRLANEVEKAHWIKKLAGAIRISEESVWNEFTRPTPETRVATTAEAVEKRTPQKSRHEQLEELVLGLMGLSVKAPEIFTGLTSDMFVKEAHRDIFNELKQNAGKTATLVQIQTDRLNHLAFRAEVFLAASPDKEIEVGSIVREFKSEHLKQKRDGLSRKIAEAEKTDEETILAALVKEYKDTCDEILKISAKKV